MAWWDLKSKEERRTDELHAEGEPWKFFDRLDPGRDKETSRFMVQTIMVPILCKFLDRIEALEREVATLKGK